MLEYLITGLMLGGIYGLIAVAFTLVYGVLGMVNFAFGGIFTISVFVTLLLTQGGGRILDHDVTLPDLPFLPAALVGLLVGGLLGVLIDRLAYKPIRSAPLLTLLIASLAVQFFLQALAQLLFGASQLPFPSPASGPRVDVFGTAVPRIDIVIMGVGIGTMALLALLVSRTPLGRGIRATAQDPETARLMGIGTERIIALTFFIGSAMTALAGILYASKYEFASATMGFLPALKGVVAAVLGGIGNIQGAFAGGIVLGLVETFGAAYIPNGSAYRDVIAYLVLAVMLWVRPQGLLGVRVTERA